jgi:hypothetical protein
MFPWRKFGLQVERRFSATSSRPLISRGIQPVNGPNPPGNRERMRRDNAGLKAHSTTE